LIITAIGVFFLLLSLHPDLDLWPILARYWPVILIIIGLGKIFDAMQTRNSDGTGGGRANLGLGSAVLALVGVFVLMAMLHGGRVVPLQ
jgi:hypothetical protein